MRSKEVKRPVRVGYSTSLPQTSPQRLGLGQTLRQGAILYRRFNRFSPSRTLKVAHRRVMPPVVVELGELVGLIYRSDKGQPGQRRAYIHLMQDPPRLVSNVEGTQLYIIGGSYRVTLRGIEG
jgi:hypothetical protein